MPDTGPTTISVEVADTVDRLRSAFLSGRTRPIEWRRAQLDRFRTMLEEREAELAAALKADLGKSAAESWMAEIGFTLAEIRHARKHLGRWMRPTRVGTPLVLQPGRSRIVPEPLGVALIIAPWNYPVQLALSPLAAAIAAGNCAVIKPSEIAPESSAAMATWLPRYLDTECFAVVEGAIPETTALLEQAFDLLFYTGSGHVGRIVMSAAAKHLTPVVLELGGKSPCIVDADVDMKVAARRIVWGKFLNAGQTCVAPDYVLVHRSQQEAFLSAVTSEIETRFGADPQKSGAYARIVSDRHFDRLSAFLSNGTQVVGGNSDRADRYIAPTVLRDVPPNAPVMQEEIFGPILPVLSVDGIAEAIGFINARDKPLALYLFSRNRDSARRVEAETSSGGFVLNDLTIQLVNGSLPFGGVGESGMGAYHGRHGFDAFSHRKAVLRRPTMFDLPLRYPPHTAGKMKWLRRLM